MDILSVESTPGYLVDQQVIAHSDEVLVTQLMGGVSNYVLLVEFLDTQRQNWVLKQARDRLAVEQEWLCSVERVIREMDTMQICHDIIAASGCAPDGRQAVVPEIHFEDRDNYIYAMTAAPKDCRVWKQDLLGGIVDSDVARSCGWLLGVLHSQSWDSQEVQSQISSTEFFDDLRLDPYYRQIARVHAGLNSPIEKLLQSNLDHRLCLVHGDYSPKNILVDKQSVVLLDFEVGHYGDPAFDLGFFLTHLHIKTLIAGTRFNEYANLIDVFWDAYQQQLQTVLSEADLQALQERAALNLGACLIARVDGKSPVEYLTDLEQQACVRQVGWTTLVEEADDLQRVREIMKATMLR